MKKILLLAYTNLNFGDDMFIKTVCSYFPSQEFELIADKAYRMIFKDIKNLYVKPYEDELIFHRLETNLDKGTRYYFKNKYKAVVYIVGSLFDEASIVNGVREYGIVNFKKLLLKNSFVEGVPFFLLGSNMTTVDSSEYKKYMEYIFQGLIDVCFRDRFSYESFSYLENIRYASDVVLNYNCIPREKKDEVIISVWGKVMRSDLYSEVKHLKRYWDPYKSFLIELITKLQRMNKRICLLALCVPEGDLDACNAVYNQLENKENVSIKSYSGNLTDTISLFEKTKYVVGTRFHSIIMAINAGCVLYPIVYEAKSENFLKDIRYQGCYSHIENISSYNVDKVVDEFKKEYRYDADDIKIDARKQFAVLDEFLKY